MSNQDQRKVVPEDCRKRLRQLDTQIGSTWLFRGLRSRELDPATGEPAWVYPPCHYKLLGVFWCYRTFQHLVGYVGLEGADLNNKYVAPLCDWDLQMSLVPEVSIPA